MVQFNEKRVLVAITGGVAAYKACDFVRQLYRLGAASVQVIMTPDAQAFVSPLVLESLTKQPVLTKALENTSEGIPTHVALAQTMDVMVILPCSANTLAKLAQGFSDNIVTTTAITFADKPMVIAPAMNTRMWENPLVQNNVKTLQALANVTVVPPARGELACGEEGEGKLADLDKIVVYVYRAIHNYASLYRGKTVVVTAGGTREPLDAVRFITNKSTGKMGVAVADELFAMGADVILLHTLAPMDKPYATIPVETVADLATQTITSFAQADGLVMAAAVSDFKAASPVSGKMKKNQTWELQLEKTQDIIKTVAGMKNANQFVVGFAAEADYPIAFAQQKLREKNLDMVVVNDISRSDIGFGTDENEMHVLFHDQDPIHLPKAPKHDIARQLLVFLAQKQSYMQTQEKTAYASIG